jgi:hypothetical protein
MADYLAESRLLKNPAAAYGVFAAQLELVSVAEGDFGASDIGMVSSTLGPPGT